ncbi:MAG: NADH-quinone oxidoreductase subunit M [Pseudomonadota bacterium]
MDNLLSIVTFTPAIAALILAIFLRGADEMANRNARWVALFATLLTFLISLFVLFGFEPTEEGFQFLEDREWMPGLQYKVGVDGISVMLVALAAFLMPLVIGASWGVEHRVKEFMISLLLFETFVLGALMALDLVLFFVFLEAAIVPVFLIVGIWGGAGRQATGFKALVANGLGAAVLLVAIVVMVSEAGTTDIPQLLNHVFDASDIRIAGLEVIGGLQSLLVLGLVAGFAVKLPLWPFHGWMPGIQAQAPVAGAVMLRTLMSVLAGYGVLRLAMPMFPLGAEAVAPLIYAVSGFAALFGALAAIGQDDLRRRIAYLSIAQMALVVMAVFAANQQGLDGAVFLLLSHGLVVAGLLLVAGALFDRTETTALDAFGGVSVRMPVLAAMFLLFTWGVVGIPGTGGFVALLLAITGVFQTSPIAALAACASLVMVAAAGLVMFRRVMLGDLIKESLKSLDDLSPRERLTLAPLAAAILALGLYPGFVTERIGPATGRLAANHAADLAAAEAARAAPLQSAGLSLPGPVTR